MLLRLYQPNNNNFVKLTKIEQKVEVFSKTLLSTGNERELELKYLKILFHISNWNFQCWNSKFLKPTLWRTGEWLVAVHGRRSIASGPCDHDRETWSAEQKEKRWKSAIRIEIWMFWTGRDKLDSLFVTCISSFMFAFDSFLTWPMVPLKQKPENGNYFTLAMWRSWFSITDGLESTDQIKRLSNFTNIYAVYWKKKYSEK